MLNGTKESCAIKHDHTILVVKVSSEHLGNCGIIFYRADVLGKVAQLLSSSIVQTTKLYGICYHHLWKS